MFTLIRGIQQDVFQHPIDANEDSVATYVSGHKELVVSTNPTDNRTIRIEIRLSEFQLRDRSMPLSPLQLL